MKANGNDIDPWYYQTYKLFPSWNHIVLIELGLTQAGSFIAQDIIKIQLWTSNNCWLSCIILNFSYSMLLLWSSIYKQSVYYWSKQSINWHLILLIHTERTFAHTLGGRRHFTLWYINICTYMSICCTIVGFLFVSLCAIIHNTSILMWFKHFNFSSSINCDCQLFIAI